MAEEVIRGSEMPLPGRCGAKLRKSNPPRYCRAWPMKGKKRCRRCGGKTPSGIASPHYRHGRYSTHLPKKLLDLYQEQLDDPNLLSSLDDISLVIARMKVHSKKQEWTAYDELLEKLRRLQDSEMRRREQAQNMLSLNTVMVIIDKVLDTIRRNVTDRDALTRIQNDLNLVLGQARSLPPSRKETT